MRNAQGYVVDVALERAAELRATTPLSFLRRMQDMLLRPPPSGSGLIAAAAPLGGGPRFVEASKPQSLPQATVATSTAPEGPLAAFSARAGGWLRGARKATRDPGTGGRLA